MKIIIERDAIVPALDALCRITPRKSPIAILSNVLIETEHEGIRLFVHALDTCMDMRVKAEVHAPGRLTVEAEALRNIARGIPQGAQITLEQDGTLLKARSARSRYSLPTLPPDDFPAMLEPQGAVLVVPAEGDIAPRLLERPAPFVATAGEGKPFLEGVWLHLHEDRLCGVGCNGKYMLITRTSIPEGAEALPRDRNGKHIIVPPTAIPSLTKALEAGGSILIAENILAAQCASVTFATKLLDFVYPDVWRIAYDRNLDICAVFDRTELEGALKRLSVVTSANKTRIHFTWGDGDEEAIARFDHAVSRGSGEETIRLRDPACGEGDIRLAQDLLGKVIGALKGEYAEMSIARDANGKPVARLHDDADPETIAVLMSMDNVE